MTYANILVHVDRSAHEATRVRFATRLAEAHDAHLIGLACTGIPYLPAEVSRQLGRAWVESRMAQLREEAQALCAEFDGSVRASGVRGHEVRAVVGVTSDMLMLHGRYADLLVLARPERPDPADALSAEDTSALLLGLGRPVLLVPGSWRDGPIGRRIAVAWSASRESARSVSDALPLLRRAAEVDVLVFNVNPTDGRHGAEPGADIATFLARHGVRVTVHNEVTPVDVGNSVLSRLADLDSDLLVMGAFGHSRLRELVMGGVTETVLRSSPVPVLMSH